MEAATITPAANPVSARWTLSFRSFLRKKTQAAPAEVPMKGIKSPIIIVFNIVTPAYFLFLLCIFPMPLK
jgi:hypothetical protein